MDGTGFPLCDEDHVRKLLFCNTLDMPRFDLTKYGICEIVIETDYCSLNGEAPSGANRFAGALQLYKEAYTHTINTVFWHGGPEFRRALHPMS